MSINTLTIACSHEIKTGKALLHCIFYFSHSGQAKNRIDCLPINKKESEGNTVTVENFSHRST